ncbi:unnamed protein product, partial [Musa textilis]
AGLSSPSATTTTAHLSLSLSRVYDMFDVIKINWIIVLSSYSGASTYLDTNSKPNLKSDLLQLQLSISWRCSIIQHIVLRVPRSMVNIDGHNRALQSQKPNRNMHGEVHVLHP